VRPKNLIKPKKIHPGWALKKRVFLNPAKRDGDRGFVPMYHQQEMADGKVNGHMIVDGT